MTKRKRSSRTRTSRRKITYQGTTGKRSGHPVIHVTNKLRAFIMVRAKSGGTKRLYLNTKIAKQRIIKGYDGLISESKKLINKLKKGNPCPKRRY